MYHFFTVTHTVNFTKISYNVVMRVLTDNTIITEQMYLHTLCTTHTTYRSVITCLNNYIMYHDSSVFAVYLYKVKYCRHGVSPLSAHFK